LYISRFYVNQFKELILIEDSIFLVDKSKSDDLILDTFYQKGYILRWLLFYLSIYDEMKDGILIKKAFEVKTFEIFLEIMVI
jgi:hypothetical protein